MKKRTKKLILRVIYTAIIAMIALGMVGFTFLGY